MRNLARDNEYRVKLHPWHVEPKSANSRKSRQHQYVSGDDPHAGHALPTIC